MNPFLRIFVSVGIVAAMILLFVTFTAAGLIIAAVVGIWLLINRLKNGSAQTDGKQNEWFHVVTVRSDGNGGFVRTETESAPSDVEVVDISPTDYHTVQNEIPHDVQHDDIKREERQKADSACPLIGVAPEKPDKHPTEKQS